MALDNIAGQGEKTITVSNVYTAILALATAAVLVTSAFIAYRCFIDYGTLFKVVQAGY